MSLIYQALQQSADPVRSGPSAHRLTPSATQILPKAAGDRTRHLVLVGAATAGIGLLGGFLISQWGDAPARNDHAAQTVRPSEALPGPSDVGSVRDDLRAAPEVVQSVHSRVEAPLPTASPNLVLTYAPPVSVKAAQPSVPVVQRASPALTPEIAPVPASSASLPNPVPVSAPESSPPPATSPAGLPEAPKSSKPETVPVVKSNDAPTVAVQTGISSSPVVSASSSAPGPEDLAARFEGMNLALENKDNAAALQHLQAIQSQLPTNSVARLRAEAWFAYQSGDPDSAQRTYRRLLERLPGDEQAALALASIEKANARPERAQDILSRSLRSNPGSAPLRSAMDQLASESAR